MARVTAHMSGHIFCRVCFICLSHSLCHLCLRSRVLRSCVLRSHMLRFHMLCSVTCALLGHMCFARSHVLCSVAGALVTHASLVKLDCCTQYIFFLRKTDRQTDIWPYRSSMLKNGVGFCQKSFGAIRCTLAALISFLSPILLVKFL